jgi:hypothetical protein
MAASLQSLFSGLSLRGQSVVGNRKSHSFVSNGNAQKLAMKAKHTFQVEVSLSHCLLSARRPSVLVLVGALLPSIMRLETS